MRDYPELCPPSRTLLGPGPSDIPLRVLEALAKPTVGHLDPYYLELMDRVQQMLRALFETENEMTFAVSATGSAGMEATVVNLIEPGDRMVVCINGVFGERMADVARRAGAEVIRVEKPWGDIFSPDDLEAALQQRPKVVGIVMAETSTGASQPIEAISEAVHDAGALLLVDAVTALGGMPVRVDGRRRRRLTHQLAYLAKNVRPRPLAPFEQDRFARRQRRPVALQTPQSRVVIKGMASPQGVDAKEDVESGGHQIEARLLDADVRFHAGYDDLESPCFLPPLEDSSTFGATEKDLLLRRGQPLGQLGNRRPQALRVLLGGGDRNLQQRRSVDQAPGIPHQRRTGGDQRQEFLLDVDHQECRSGCFQEQRTAGKTIHEVWLQGKNRYESLYAQEGRTEGPPIGFIMFDACTQ